MTEMISAVIYALGFVGLAAVTLIPLRSWHLFRKFFGRHSSLAAKLILMFIGLLVGIALAFEVWIVIRIFQCLTEDYCGPSRAHGWIFLAVLGAVYLAFETLLAVVSAVARQASRGAT